MRSSRTQFASASAIVQRIVAGGLSVTRDLSGWMIASSRTTSVAPQSPGPASDGSGSITAILSATRSWQADGASGLPLPASPAGCGSASAANASIGTGAMRPVLVSGCGTAVPGSAFGLCVLVREGFAGFGAGSADLGWVDFNGVGNGDADGVCACTSCTSHSTSMTGKIAKKRPTMRVSPANAAFVRDRHSDGNFSFAPLC